MTETLTPLTALSPLDGRYAAKTTKLRAYFSEWALMRARLEVEAEWLICMAKQTGIAEVPAFKPAEEEFLRGLAAGFSLQDAMRIKEIESVTRHDVKAVEYFLKEKLDAHASLAAVREFAHFACTSEDINNLAYALLLHRARAEVLLPAMRELCDKVRRMAGEWAAMPMLARTHGQPASPTTVGKEFAVFANRLQGTIDDFARQPIYGKFNGASGTFGAHLAAYPALDWHAIARDFVTGLGLRYQPVTTQIEPHDFIAAYCHSLCRFGAVVLDLCRDMWGYIALGYFAQNTVAGEVGSSAMPHKVNPIDFENAEGNVGVAGALLHHFAEKLPVSRWQRDLSDSTVLRCLGVGFGHALLAWRSAAAGLDKLRLNEARLRGDLEDAWEVLAEPVQTVMRKYGVAGGYERLRDLTRGGRVTREELRAFIAGLAIPEEEKGRLLAMRPGGYVGAASTPP